MIPDAEDFRELFWEQGEPIWWYSAMPCTCYRPKDNDYTRDCPNHCEFGFLYQRRLVAMNGEPLAGTDEDGPCAVIQGKKTALVETQSGNFTGFGDATIMTMPDEIPLVRPDKYVLIARQHICSGETKQRDTDDKLSYPFVIDAINLIDTDGEELEKGIDYKVSGIPDSDFSEVEWLSNKVPVGKNYSIRYSYHPQMWFLEMMDKSPRWDRLNNELLPHRGVLTIKHPYDKSA